MASWLSVDGARTFSWYCSFSLSLSVCVWGCGGRGAFAVNGSHCVVNLHFTQTKQRARSVTWCRHLTRMQWRCGTSERTVQATALGAQARSSTRFPAQPSSRRSDGCCSHCATYSHLWPSTPLPVVLQHRTGKWQIFFLCRRRFFSSC